MVKLLRHIVLLCMLVCSALGAAGQSTLPDTVCVGATKHYWVDETVGSVYTWKIDGVAQSSTTHEIYITWNTAGDYLLTVQEKSADSCLGPIRSLPVHVKYDPPSFIAPTDKTFCVENIDSATYYDPTMDITPDRPDYYLFEAGDTILDLDTTMFVDHCCDTVSPVIHWQIDFNGGIPSSIIGTGQPSTYGTDIQFPGSVTGDVVHTVTYWLTNCYGTASLPQTINVTIKPRPNIIKQ